MEPTAALGRIGRYELVARIGAGGMGEVYLARASGAAGFVKQVVIKRMLPHLESSEAFVRRFIEEGKLLVQLRHAGIAQVLDMGQEGGAIFLAMEYVDGRDLRQALRLARASGELPSPDVVVALLWRVLEALDYAHSAKDDAGQPLGIIHRDVSPSNVMLSRSGEVKLVDFGIARAADRLGLSASGALQGKFGYMSPEQAAGEALDGRSDLFSVGVMAWELVAGRRPFDAESDLKTLERIRTHDPGSLGEAVPDAPPELVAVVDRLLSKDPAQRFASGGDALGALQAYFYRTEAMAGAREIAAWLASVLATLPPALQGPPRAGVSLDEALQLPLDGVDPALLAGRGDGRTATASAPDIGPSVERDIGSESGPGSGPDIGQDAGPGSGPPGQAPLAQHVSAERALGAGGPITVTVPPETPRRARVRRSLVALLVLANVLLLGAVGWLVAQLTDDEGSAASPTALSAADGGSEAVPGGRAAGLAEGR